MTSTDQIPTPKHEQQALSSFRSTSDRDTPIDQYPSDSTPPIHPSHRQIGMSSYNAPPSVSSSPSVVRNPSPPPLDDLSRADMVGDEMYSKSWFCRVLLKLIQFVAPEQLNDATFATIRQQDDDDFLSKHAGKKQELDETFEGELCELWDISVSADVAHLLIEFKALDLFHVVLLECKDKRCNEIVLGILSNLACCKRHISAGNEEQSIAQIILQHSNLLNTILSILTSDDYSDCPSLVQLFRLIYTLFVRQDTRLVMLEHVQLAYEPICFILQSCCNQDLLEQCSYLLRILFDECHLFEQNEQQEVMLLFLTSITTAISTLIEKNTTSTNVILENLFNSLQIYTTYEHCSEMLNEHCQIIMGLVATVLDRLVHDDIVQIRSVLMLSCISICNFYLEKNGLKILSKELLEYFLIIGHTCYKDRQRREHHKHVARRQRSRTHSHSSSKRKDADEGKAHDSRSLSTTESDDVQSTSEIDFNRSTSEDLSSMSYTLVDDLFLELFHRGIKQDSSDTAESNGTHTSKSIFSQLTHDQRELFRKIIKHFCNLDKRLDDLLDL